jgi:hypothetical protein
MNRRSILRISAMAIGVALVPSAMTLKVDAGSTVQAPAVGAAARLLPGTIIIPIDVVSMYFPEIAMVASTGPNQGAVGRPVATRATIYTSSDSTQKVTISVDEYATAADASATYQEAVQGSLNAPGFSLLSPPNVGQQAYAGTSTMGDETHVGLGVQQGRLIVAATIAGYDVTPESIANVFAIAAKETDLVRTTAGGS